MRSELLEEQEALPGKESFPAFVRRCATSATPVQLLLVIAAACGVVWLADLASRRLPLLALSVVLLALAVISVALWGLIHGPASRPLSGVAVWAGRGLLVLGMLCGVIAGVLLLLALLGRPWMS